MRPTLSSLSTLFAAMLATLAVAGVAVSGSADAAPGRSKVKGSKKAEKPTLTCARAAYPGDPVCDLVDDNAKLPTPSSRLIRNERDASGFLVGDGITVDGKTNFNENRFGAAPLHKLTPNPSARAQTNGGAQVDFRF